MATPNPQTCMLTDVQYTKQDKKNKIPDYLYLIWRDLETQEKYLNIIPNPEMTIYFEKKELRTHDYNKSYARLDEVEPKKVRYADIPTAIAEDWLGKDGAIRYFQNIRETNNWGALSNLFLYPYVFGADYDAMSFYRIQWIRNLNNSMPKKLHKGFLDIEVDSIDIPGMPTAEMCPINAVTLIDDWNNDVYTFLLIHSEFKPQGKPSDEARLRLYNKQHEDQDDMIEDLDEFNDELHKMFDESYGKLNYHQYFYTDEAKMLVHLFQLIHKLKLDFIGIWNMSFD